MKRIIIHYKNGKKYRYEINDEDVTCGCNGIYYKIWTREYGYYNIPMKDIKKIEFQRTELEDIILGLKARARALNKRYPIT